MFPNGEIQSWLKPTIYYIDSEHAIKHGKDGNAVFLKVPAGLINPEYFIFHPDWLPQFLDAIAKAGCVAVCIRRPKEEKVEEPIDNTE